MANKIIATYPSRGVSKTLPFEILENIPTATDAANAIAISHVGAYDA